MESPDGQLAPKGLIEGNLVDGSLQDVLLGLVTLVQSQQADLQRMNLTISTLSSLENVDAKLSSLESKMATQILQNLDKINELQGQFDVYTTVTNANIKSISDKCGAAMDEIALLTARIENMEIQQLTDAAQIKKNLDEKLGPVLENVKSHGESLSTIGEIFNKNGMESFSSLAKRVMSVEEQIQATHRVTDSVQDDIKTLSNAQTTGMKQLKDNTSVELHAIRKLLQERNTISSEGSEKVPEDGALSRSVYRNSRRLDGLDECYSSLRIEVENISDAMSNVHDNLKQFSHYLYDHKVSTERLKLDFTARFQALQQFFRWIGSNIKDLWSAESQTADGLHHSVSGASKSVEDLYAIMCNISSKPLPSINSLDEAAVETGASLGQIKDRRATYDFERQMLLIANVFKKPQQNFTEESEEMQDYEPKIKRKKPTVSLDSGSAAPYGFLSLHKEDPLSMITLEEIRVKMNELERRFPVFVANIEESVGKIEKELASKIDYEEVDRHISQIERALMLLQRNGSRQPTSDDSPRTVKNFRIGEKKIHPTVRSSMSTGNTADIKRPRTQGTSRLASSIMDPK